MSSEKKFSLIAVIVGTVILSVVVTAAVTIAVVSSSRQQANGVQFRLAKPPETKGNPQDPPKDAPDLASPGQAQGQTQDPVKEQSADQAKQVTANGSETASGEQANLVAVPGVNEEADFTNPDSVFSCFVRQKYTIDYRTIDEHYSKLYPYVIDGEQDDTREYADERIYKIKARREITELKELEITTRKELSGNFRNAMRPVVMYDAVVRTETNGQQQTVLVRAFLYAFDGIWHINSYREDII